jgi:hypothetical protein
LNIIDIITQFRDYYGDHLRVTLKEKLEKTCSENDIKVIEKRIDRTNGEISSIKEEYDGKGNLDKTTVSITYIGEDGKNHRTQVEINHTGGSH